MVQEKDLSHSALRLWLHLAFMATQKGDTFFVTYPEIQQETGVSARHMNEYVRELSAHGMLRHVCWKKIEGKWKHLIRVRDRAAEEAENVVEKRSTFVHVCKKQPEQAPRGTTTGRNRAPGGRLGRGRR